MRVFVCLQHYLNGNLGKPLFLFYSIFLYLEPMFNCTQEVMGEYSLLIPAY